MHPIKTEYILIQLNIIRPTDNSYNLLVGNLVRLHIDRPEFKYTIL